MSLPAQFLSAPIAHRGLHTGSRTRPENSMAAFEAAIMFSFGIELDVQLTRDGIPVVFHDYDLQRLLSRTGSVQSASFADLQNAKILGSNEAPPALRDVLELVGGQVPLLIDLKDQSGNLTGTTGALEGAVAAAIDGYSGPVALMSFNPDQMIAMRRLAPDVPRGLITEAFVSDEWGLVSPGRKDQLIRGLFLTEAGASFISHKHTDLNSALVSRTRAAGLPVFSWTITSEQQEQNARQLSDNITFENYLPNA